MPSVPAARQAGRAVDHELRAETLVAGDDELSQRRFPRDRVPRPRASSRRARFPRSAVWPPSAPSVGHDCLENGLSSKPWKVPGHVARAAPAVVADIPANPVQVCLFGAQTVVSCALSAANLVHQPRPPASDRRIAYGCELAGILHRDASRPDNVANISFRMCGKHHHNSLFCMGEIRLTSLLPGPQNLNYAPLRGLIAVRHRRMHSCAIHI